MAQETAKIELHPEARARLLDAVASGLSSIVTKHGKYLDDTSRFVSLYNADQSLPTTGKLREKIVSYIEEFPIIGFVSDQISRELEELDNYQSDKPQLKLADVDGYADTKALAESLVAKFESLPWYYLLTLKLPEALSDTLSKFDEGFAFSKTLWLSPVNDEFLKRYPINAETEKAQKRIYQGAGLLSFLSPDKQEWDNKFTYLQVATRGYISRYGSSQPGEAVGRAIRSFFGLGLALRLFSIERNYSPFLPKTQILVHRLHGEKLILDTRYEMGEQISRAISGITLNNLEGRLVSSDDKVGWALHRFREMRSVFDAGQRSDTVLLASQWLFDSYTGHDQLLSYIQAMTVLEILFGEEGRNEVSLGELIRNRCAYLIGKTHEERAEILKDFKEIYRVRSLILHRGKHRLDINEFGLFRNLRWLCQRAIQEEVKLLITDVEKKKEQSKKIEAKE